MVENYLKEKYNKTKWPFFSLPEILQLFGEQGRAELNQLRKQGKVKRRQGANNPLIELL